MKEKPMINKESLMFYLKSMHPAQADNYARSIIRKIIDYANEECFKTGALHMLSKTLPDITEDELRFHFERPFDIFKRPGCINCIDDIMVEDDHINFTYELWFDVDNYFITETNGTEDWINFYTDWHPDGSITAMFIIDKADGSPEEHNWKLTIKEKEFFRNLMEKHCQKLYQKSIEEVWQEVQIDQDESFQPTTR